MITLKNCTVLNSHMELEKKDIHIKNGKFVQSASPTSKVENMKGVLVLPGLVNTHTHAAMSLFRGIAEDVELYEWLSTYIFPREAKLTEDDVYIGSLVSFMEMIKNGITTFVDMYFFQDAVAQAAKDIGIRGVITRGLADVDGHGKEKLKECEEFINAYKDDPMVRGGVGPHALYTCSDGYFEEAVRLAKETDSVLTFHLLESPLEREDYVKRTGKESVDFLDSIGAFFEKTIVAHGTHLNEGELSVLAKNGATLSYNPISNAKLGNGIAPIVNALKKGVNVTLGTDSAASNNSLNLFDEMKVGALMQRAISSDPTVMKVKEVFSMATSNASKALPFDVGSLEIGMSADLVVVNTNCPPFLPREYMKSHIVYSFNTSAVEKVMINGQWVYDKGFLNVNADEVMRKFEKTVSIVNSRL